MTRVLVNREDCSVQVKGDLITFLYATVAKDPLVVASRNVTQLLRSRKDDTAAKLVADGESYVLKFESLRDREGFIESIVRAQEAEQALSNDEWVASTICHAAVDVGVLDQEELRAIMSAAGQRGVEQAFDALETLVDRETFQLLPITEQMENDVLRQTPVLAAIFQERVVDKETKKSFWEAVVRKYFCFSRTFLEEDIQRLEGARSVATAASPPLSGSAATSSLSVINASSMCALPKGAATAMLDTDINEEDLLHLDENVEPLQQSFHGLFAAHRHLPVGSASVLPVNGAALPFPQETAEPSPVYRPRFVGFRVLHQLPSETIEKAALETLRTFWRSSVKQRRSILAKYTRISKKGGGGFIQRMCLEQADRAVQNT
ncbi:conserved hypothetical protein [Leishmania major strain Friedlin]|uniref:Uncharacterized protein n=1 Tax=Leishmania major TaxID=5664 RepID=Q4Q1A8_LEIMA|nr:conserved hypothetical protein [Leishmania major strain Friedlin]CAG9583847.1 hypothetical_protein_-_conserved [Leishmania major strain Friedlin]CAJ09273.1 conserved hypothetical protein [Leishmania major strain Friedlin]|eukprot:XP_001686890.1 conserved hypothetical protein [Leishmania major strain Friedlin]